MNNKYILMEIKPNNSDNTIRLYFKPKNELKFSVVSILPNGYEHFEGSFFCLPDANTMVYNLCGN